MLLPLAVDALPLRQGSVTYTAEGTRDTLFTLPAAWVILDSLHVFRNGEELSEFTDWRVAEPGNRVWVFRPLAPGDSLHVDYMYEAAPIFRSYARRSLREIGRELPRAGPDSARIAAAPVTEPASLEGWSRLNKSGSLIRSVQVGTGQDLQLESALNLQIQGRVGRNVNVVAALTDQNTPIQPEGTTESLNELEKVFVSVRSPHFATTLGDYTLDLKGGQYDVYNRKLTGVLGEVTYPGVMASAAGAVSRGQFATNTFDGQEANQGPYPLHGRNGEINMVVLAGTEKVWLNGEQMRRGEGNDYTIDYSAGEITFTARRVISSESRIVVDFEYASENYERLYGAGRTAVNFGAERFGGSATIISESDDRTRPVGLALTAADRAILARAGDNPDSAVIAAADSVGLAGGDYVRADTVYAGVSYSVFRFLPRDSLNKPTGQWRVLFDDFGVGHGDYEAGADALGVTYFRWVGPGFGRYRPFRRLPLPEQHNLADIRLHASPLRGITLAGEAAASQRDNNTFSRRDDAGNDGNALTATAAFDRQRPRLLFVTPYRVTSDVRVRWRDKQFTELNRAQEVEFARDWNTAVNAGTAETIREANLAVSPLSWTTVRGGYGDLERTGSLSSRRKSVGLSALLFKQWNLAADHLTLESSDSLSGRRGFWIRQSGGLNGTRGRFSPRSAVQREWKRDRARGIFSGFRFVDYLGGMRVDLPAHFNVDGEYRRRLDEVIAQNGRIYDAARTYTASSEASWNPPEGGRTLARFTHRKKNYLTPDSTDVATNVGHLETLIAPRNRIVEANAVYDVANTRSQSQVLIAQEVPAGTGNYRREGERFVPDDQGNYLLVPRYTGSFAPATELSLNALLWVRPDELSPLQAKPWLRALSTETELVIEEQTRRPLNAGLLLLDQRLFRDDSTTLTGSLSLRQDLHINRLSQKLATRLRYRESQSLQNQYLNGGQARTLHEGGVRVRARYLRMWRGESELSVSHEVLHYNSGIFPSRDIDRAELTQVNTLALSMRWEGGLDLRAVEANDQRTTSQVSLRELKPHAALVLTGRGRVDGDMTWTHAGSNQKTIPFELGQGANRGENLRWTLRGTYQFGQTFSGSINYTGRRDAGERTFHTGRLEVRASF